VRKKRKEGESAIAVNGNAKTKKKTRANEKPDHIPGGVLGEILIKIARRPPRLRKKKKRGSRENRGKNSQCGIIGWGECEGDTKLKRGSGRICQKMTGGGVIKKKEATTFRGGRGDNFWDKGKTDFDKTVQRKITKIMIRGSGAIRPLGSSHGKG